MKAKSTAVKFTFLAFVLFQVAESSKTKRQKEIVKNPELSLLGGRDINTGYIPELIDLPLDVLYIVDKSSSNDADLRGIKCLLRNVTTYFNVTGGKKVQISLINPRDPPHVDFSFRRYSDYYGYQRALEYMQNEPGRPLMLGKALNFAREKVLVNEYNYGVRRDVAKVIVLVVASPSVDDFSEELKLLSIRAQTVFLTVGYDGASYKQLKELTSASGEKYRPFYKRKSHGLCSLWKDVHKRLREKLLNLFLSPIDAPKDISFGINHHYSAEITWSRPRGLIDFYSIKYKTQNGDQQNFSVQNVKTERVRLENLESTEYEVVMTSYGMNTSSSEYKFEFDMACASITADILVLIDTSTIKQTEFNELTQNFLLSFVKGYVVAPHATRIGIILYSDEARYVAPLSTYTTKNDLLLRLRRLFYDNGKRRTGLALNYAYLRGFEYSRRDAFKVVLFITGGKPEDNTTLPLKRLKKDGALTLKIEVDQSQQTSRKSSSQLNMRVRTNKYLEGSDWLNSTDAKYLDYNFTVPSYKLLKAVQHKISDVVCNEAFRYYRKVNPVLPSPIRLHVSDVTNTTVEVTWEQSSSSKITGYDVTIDSTGKTYSIGRRRRNFKVWDLLPGHEYNIVVTATGLGRRSSKRLVTAKTETPAPKRTEVFQLPASLVEIFWDPPESVRYVTQFQVSVYLTRNNQAVINIFLDKYETSYQTNKLYPGTEYEVWVLAMYGRGIKSEPAKALFVTEMPQPANFRMSKAYETQVQLSWDLLDFKKHDKNTELAYYVQVTDDRGYMVGQQQLYNKTIAKHLDHDNKTVYCWVENLIPGKSLTATLQASLESDVSSHVSTIHFKTKKVKLAVDIAFLVEISPSLMEEEFISTRNFLKSLAGAFDHDSEGVVSFGTTQLTSQPVEKISMQKKLTENEIMTSLNSLYPLSGSENLKPEDFTETVKRTFKHARSGVPRIMFLLATNQHYTNLMPEHEQDFADEGITSIVLQMAFQPQPIYSNQSVMHRYVLSSYDQLHLVANLIVVDIVRSVQFPLKIVEQERDVKPLAVAVFRDTTRKNVVEWWAPNDWPRNYSMSLQPANSESYVWSQNVTVKKRVQYGYRFMSTLQADASYYFVLEAHSGKNFSASITVPFDTDSRGRIPSIHRSEMNWNHLFTHKEVMLPNGQCCAVNKPQKNLRMKARHIKHLKVATKKIGTCLQSGSNLLFLIDGSDSTNEKTFLQTKSMLKKLVKSLKIESIEKLAESKKRQFVRRGILHKIPKVMTHGIGLSITQFAHTSVTHLPLVTKTTNKQLSRTIEDIQQIHGKVNLNDALRFLQETTMSKYTKAIRDIIIIISSENNEQRAVERSKNIKQQNEEVRLITVDIGNVKSSTLEALASKPRSKYNLNSDNPVDSSKFVKKLQDVICRAAIRKNDKSVTKKLNGKKELS